MSDIDAIRIHNFREGIVSAHKTIYLLTIVSLVAYFTTLYSGQGMEYTLPIINVKVGSVSAFVYFLMAFNVLCSVYLYQIVDKSFEIFLEIEDKVIAKEVARSPCLLFSSLFSQGVIFATLLQSWYSVGIKFFSFPTTIVILISIIAATPLFVVIFRVKSFLEKGYKKK